MDDRPGPLEVRRYGEAGPVVVVLHGGPGAQGSVADLAAALGAWFSVLEPLQRRSGSHRLTVARHVEDLAEVCPPGAMLVGWSWGAMLALSFAARHPDVPRAIALVGIGTYDPESRAAYAAEMQRRLGCAGRARMRDLSDDMRRAIDPDERDRRFATIGRLASAAQGVDVVPWDGVVPVDGRGYQQTWSDVLRLQRRAIEPQSFAAIGVPVVMLHGDQDPHPGPRIRDRLRSVIPQLEFVELPACGHEPWRERQARDPFLSALRDWLLARSASPTDPDPVPV